MRQTLVSLLALALAGCASLGPPAPSHPTPSQPQTLDVPRMQGLTIDGRADDWGDAGFRVGILYFEQGQIPARPDFDPRLRLAWDDRGLIVLVECRDDVGQESENINSLWKADCIELFVGEKRGGTSFYQLVVGPGIDPGQKGPRFKFHNVGNVAEPPGGFQAEVASTVQPGGYVCEIRLPWSNLRLRPALGDEAALQLYVNDYDGRDDKRRAIWYPQGETHADSSRMYRIRLAQNAGAPQELAAAARYDRLRWTSVSVLANGELAGRTAVVREGARELARGVLAADGDRASAVLRFAMPPRDRTWAPLTVSVDGRSVEVTLPDAREERARSLAQLAVEFDPFVFSGAKLPPCAIRNAREVEDVLGPYRVDVACYDGAGNPVTVAPKCGRYAAVVTITPESGGPVLRRYRTLYRLDANGPLWRIMENWTPQTLELPGFFGVDPAVAKGRQRDVEMLLRDGLWSGLERHGSLAAILAGMHEAQPGEPCDVYHDAAARDRQWWVAFKRKAWGTDRTFTTPFQPPRKEPGLNAPVVREGTLSEAGMKPDAAATLDHLLTEWAAASDEAFAVCIVRRGVIVLHKAYGQRDGAPMTVDTRSWMASITKLLAANLMWQAVDQGLVDLDDPVARFLPPLAEARFSKPPTIRHCYTHTSGLWDHWGDGEPDFEHIVAEYGPNLRVGERYQYTGTGLALGSKVLEQLSGKALPQLYHDHLWKPLGCTNTAVTDSGGGCASVPLEMARVGQMLLNGGAYGDLRFFQPRTLQRMLPEKQVKTLGPDTTVITGIGCTWMDEAILGPGTFGHGAASAATFRVCPAHDLVVVMTRNGSGKAFDQYHPRFLQAVVDAIAKP